SGASALRRQRWVALQNHGRARLREGTALAAAGIGCAGDLSDGLLIDASRTAAACGCAAGLWRDAGPVDPQLPGALPREWVALAPGGGEAFELLAAVPMARLDELLAAWPPALAALTVVGRLLPGEGVHLLEREGSDAEVEPPGVRSRHFVPGGGGA